MTQHVSRVAVDIIHISNVYYAYFCSRSCPCKHSEYRFNETFLVLKKGGFCVFYFPVNAQLEGKVFVRGKKTR